ncbi:acetyltransferase [Curtobacterium sp. Csp1]|uniref:GNAT family N-acetyltransferase n=1 Tax=unclassified Curtobacterium TaxID=257496 RepID=UPI0015977730|nr:MULTISPECIES: acetyltransferase [unclassified Curtobacterium]QKS12800.1 acetyltransferase [Curtobacterium sp. csp3]QKS20341.1 acetyltransferase [Curtobacterium sp. Csp1]
MGDVVVLPADAPRRVELERRGWRVVARSFGAQLDGDAVDRTRLRSLVDRAGLPVRALDVADVDAVLALDVATVGHYPGSVATRHEPFDRERATPSAVRRAFGAWSGDDLVAMTFVDVLVGAGGAAAGSDAGSDAAAGSDATAVCAAASVSAETDVTVVAADHRGRGIGTAVKAASVLALLDAGVTRFRTGGSADNPAIIAANTALGYVRDEEWVTLEPSAP